jgi:hypothetical protein
MNWTFEPYAAVLLVSAGLAAALAVLGWHRRSTPGGIQFVALMSGAALWSLTDFVMLGFADLGTHFLLAKVSWLGAYLTPLSVLAFALADTDRTELYRRVRLVLVRAYAVAILAVWTNPYHHLVYRGAELDTSGALPVLQQDLGPLFGLLVGFGTCSVLAGSSVLLLDTLAARPAYCRQYALVAAGPILPVVSMVAWAVGVVPVPGLDPTPFAFAVMGALFAVAMFSYRLLDLTPVARHALIDDLLDLARQGQGVTDTERVEVEVVATDAWRHVDSSDAVLTVEGSRGVEADRLRLVQLFENLFRNSVEHGSTSSQRPVGADDSVEPSSTSSRPKAGDSVEHGSTSDALTVRVGVSEDGFYVEDDGPGIPEGDRETVFDVGFTTSPNGTGFGLGIVAEIVEAHGWAARATEGRDGGARFEVRTPQSPDGEPLADAESTAG